LLIAIIARVASPQRGRSLFSAIALTLFRHCGSLLPPRRSTTFGAHFIEELLPCRG